MCVRTRSWGGRCNAALRESGKPRAPARAQLHGGVCEPHGSRLRHIKGTVWRTVFQLAPVCVTRAVARFGAGHLTRTEGHGKRHMLVANSGVFVNGRATPWGQAGFGTTCQLLARGCVRRLREQQRTGAPTSALTQGNLEGSKHLDNGVPAEVFGQVDRSTPPRKRFSLPWYFALGRLLWGR